MTKVIFSLFAATLLYSNLVAQPLKFTGYRPNENYNVYLHFEKLLCKGDSIIGFNEDFYAVSFNKGKDWKSHDYKGKIFLDDGTNPEALPSNIFLKGNDIIIYSWGRFFISRNFGQTFERISQNKTLERTGELGTDISTYNGYVVNDSYVLLSQDGLYSSKDCNTWRKLNTPEGIQIISFASYEKEMFIFSLKNLYKSGDNGETWSKLDDFIYKHNVDVMRSFGSSAIEVKMFDNKMLLKFVGKYFIYDLKSKAETPLDDYKCSFVKDDMLFILTKDKTEKTAEGYYRIVGNGEIFLFKNSLVKSYIDISSLCTADMKDFCGITNFYLSDDYIVLNGEGSLSLNEMSIELKPGCVAGNCYTGKGTYLFADGEKYVGDFKNGKYDGYGEITFANGQKYVGEWENDLQNGKGTYTYSDGRMLTGNWGNGSFISSTYSQNGQGSNNSNFIQNNSIINLAASDCKDKIIRSNDYPSNIEYKNFRFDKDDIAKEICSNSNNSLTEYVNKNGQTVGYCIYYFSPSGKRIKDEILDSKGRLMQQSLYEYTPNDKAEFMFVLNYLGEITSLRAVGTDGMRDANFESPYPTSKEKAIYRYNHPDKMSFTDPCQECRGTGHANNNLKRCYICNGAGSITHTIIKY
jgi:hypothetical protein